MSRRMCGIWVADQIVNSSPTRSHDDRARLHRGRDQPLLDVAALDDDAARRRNAASRSPPVEDPGVALVGALVGVHQVGALRSSAASMSSTAGSGS